MENEKSLVEWKGADWISLNSRVIGGFENEIGLKFSPKIFFHMFHMPEL